MLDNMEERRIMRKAPIRLRATTMSISLEQGSEIIKMLGLVGAGLWAAWTFQKLQRVREAEFKNRQICSSQRRNRRNRADNLFRHRQTQWVEPCHLTSAAAHSRLLDLTDGLESQPEI